MLGEISRRLFSFGAKSQGTAGGNKAESPGGQVDGYSPSGSSPPSPYHKPVVSAGGTPLSAKGHSSTGLLRKKGEALGMLAAPAAIPGPAGLSVGLTLHQLQAMASKTTLEDKDVLTRSLVRATEQMGQTSGIVELPKGVPTMVIPDIHAQRDYLVAALQHKVNGESVFDLLKQGKMNLLILGDGMHSESRGQQRWLMAERDHLRGVKDSASMKQEVVESFGTMKMVMDLKSELGDHFVYLRGNHDDIVGGFRKYCSQVGESELIKTWVKDHYGGDLLDLWSDFEQAMPLVAKGTGFVASHAAPGATLTRAEIESRSEKAFHVLSWTDNTAWTEQGAKREIFTSNRETVQASASDRWLVGHRKVTGSNYRSQFDNSLIQINPTQAEGFVVALIGADGSFDPQVDTFPV